MLHLSPSLLRKMLRCLPLLSILLQLVTTHAPTSLSAQNSDALKIKCDALPYRTLYFESKCYFVIDAEADSAFATTNRCFLILSGSNFTQAGAVPDSVFNSLFVEKGDFMSDGDSAGKKKAMCISENRLPAASGYITSIARETISHGLTTLIARMNLPFSGRFPEQLQPGQLIIVKGVFTDPREVVINFQKKNQEQIAFHFNIRFYSGVVHISTAAGWINGNTAAWQTPDIRSIPLRRGDPFDIRFRLYENYFQVLIDKMEFCKYNYRLPLSSITHIFVGGQGYLTFASLGEKYNSIPYSPTMAISADDNGKEGRDGDGEETSAARWALPYLEPLNPLQVGQTIIIKGAFSADCHEGVVNFQAANMAQIAFHFNLRFYSGIVMMGTASGWVNGQLANWSPPETRPIPFQRGQEFDIRFRIHDDFFQVNVNGNAFYEYRYKLPLSTVTHLHIGGSGYLTLVETGEKFTARPVEMPGFPVCGKPSCAAQGEMFTRRVQVPDCKTLFVSGIANGNFFIRLYRKNGEIALVINPRFDLNSVTLNTLKGGRWLTEQRVNKFPFKRDTQFQVAITNEARGFQILVNGLYFATYGHKTCAYDISIIETEGIYETGVQI